MLRRMYNLGMTEVQRTILIAGIAAFATVSAASIAALAAYFSGKRERRRLLYGEAYKAALGWSEMLYRVRRRHVNDSEVVEQFHELQERITYYRGWIGSESRYMQRSFDRFVKAVKDGTEQLITEAWDEPERPLPGNAKPDDKHPIFDTESKAFLRDVRSYLSPLCFRKIAVIRRNSKGI